MSFISKESANEIIGKLSCYDKKYHDGTLKNMASIRFQIHLLLLGYPL